MFNFIVSLFNNFYPAPLPIFTAAWTLMDIFEDNDHMIQNNVVNLLQVLGTYQKVKEYQNDIPESNEEDFAEMFYWDAN